MNIYLFCVGVEKRTKVKQMYDFIQNYSRDWFPNLPFYVAFATRLDKLSAAFQIQLNTLIEEFKSLQISFETGLLDSMPIVSGSGKREGKVAKEITNKGFCSTKNLFYYGVKLHVLVYRSDGRLPHIERFIIAEASEGDLKVFKEYWSTITNRTFYCDKAYINKGFFETLYQEMKTEMLTPTKAVRTGIRRNTNGKSFQRYIFNSLFCSTSTH